MRRSGVCLGEDLAGSGKRVKGSGVGRPRASGAAASRPDARQAVLDAAGALFTDAGYAATTTRAIAERAGLRQASLYYHFPAKEDILAALLADTVRPSLAVAADLLAADAPVAARLWALAYADIRLLGGARHNLGALYLLPEVASPNLARFRSERAELRSVYRNWDSLKGSVIFYDENGDAMKEAPWEAGPFKQMDFLGLDFLRRGFAELGLDEPALLRGRRHRIYLLARSTSDRDAPEVEYGEDTWCFAVLVSLGLPETAET